MGIMDTATSALGATMGMGVTPTISTISQTRDIENYLREQKRQADRDYSLRRDALDQDYAIARQNARTARERSEIDKWYNKQQVKLAEQRLAMEDRHFGEDLAFRRQVHADELGLNRARLGYDILGTAANLRGPDDYFAASNYSRGVAAQPGSATFLNALRDNTQLAGFGAQAGVPAAATVNSLMGKMGGPSLMPGTGAGATGTQDVDALHRQIQAIGAAGAHKLGAGSLEQLTDTELKLLMGGLGTAGPDGKAFDVPTFMDQYRRSRIGNPGDYRAA